MLRVWDKPLTDEDKEKLIAKVAGEIRKRRLEVPAVLFFEMHKPLANVAAHAVIAFSPFIMPFLGFRTVDEYSLFISERENIERLIQALEEGEPGGAKA